MSEKVYYVSDSAGQEGIEDVAPIEEIEYGLHEGDDEELHDDTVDEEDDNE